MIEINVTQAVLKQAAINAQELGPLRNDTTGDNVMSNFIGEIVVAQFLGASINNTSDYDLLLNNTKINVKAKRTSIPPRPHYECSMVAHDIRKQCDWYVFVRVRNDNYKAWIVGYLPKEEYFKTATLLKKGETDPSGNFTVKADCYNVAISSLRSLGSIISDNFRRVL